MGNEPAGDRRPIASRDLAIWQRAAQMLARAGVSANGISVGGMISGLLAGGVLMCSGCALGVCPGVVTSRILFLVAAALIQLRLLANMLDGMVAIASGKASAVGELFNEIPDRVSDTAILVGAGYACGAPMLGWIAAAVALFVTYVRALGKGMGVPGLFQGPMSKSHRMFVLTVTCVYMAVAPGSWRGPWVLAWPRVVVGPMGVALGIVIVGGVVTAWRRVARIVAAVKERR